MISCPDVRKDIIRQHYNISTVFYRLLWGQHIHHGLWSGDESPKVSGSSADGTAGPRSRYSAERSSCRYWLRNGRFINSPRSPSELSGYWCDNQFFPEAMGRMVVTVRRDVFIRARFVCHDAETVELPQESFDVAWSVECTEHLFDKPAFFRMATWLRPGGKVAIVHGSPVTILSRKCSDNWSMMSVRASSVRRWDREKGLCRLAYVRRPEDDSGA